jgi:hypothetical protein
MKYLIWIFFASIILNSCSRPTPVEQGKKKIDSVETTPATIVQAIKSKFPAAVPYKEGIDSVLRLLNQFGIESKSMLWVSQLV